MRDVVRGQVVTATESMRRHHEQGVYFLQKDVEERDRDDPGWMKEGQEAGKVLEVRWGRRSMNVAWVNVKKMTTCITTQSGDCARAKRGRARRE